MRKILTLLAVVFFASSSFAVVSEHISDNGVTSAAFQDLHPDLQKMNVEDFLTMTPKKYRQITGERLGFKNAVILKAAQRKIKKNAAGTPDVPKGVFILCAILVPIAAVIFMGLADDWSGNNWWVALLLYALCYLPGLIFTLIKMKEYY